MSKITQSIKILSKKYNKKPKLAIITTSNFFSVNLYVKNKIISCNKTHTQYIIFKTSAHVKTQTLISIIKLLNINNSINGILIQLPLPKYIKKSIIFSNINTYKDLDMLNPKNFGNYMTGYKKSLTSCTPKGVYELFKNIKIKLKGLNICLIGFSNIVGKPLVKTLTTKGATVTIINKYNSNFLKLFKNIDIFIIALGIRNYISYKDIPFGSIIIDIGINKYKNKIITGDIKINNIIKKTSYITSAPNGIGLMTILNLLTNNLKLFVLQNKKNRKYNGWTQ